MRRRRGVRARGLGSAPDRYGMEGVEDDGAKVLGMISGLVGMLQQAEVRLEMLRATLGFYADSDNWEVGHPTKVTLDEGERARVVLEKTAQPGTTGCTWNGRKDGPVPSLAGPVFPCFRYASVTLRENSKSPHNGNPFREREVCEVHAEEMCASGFYLRVT